jgi:hypothetical protein
VDARLQTQCLQIFQILSLSPHRWPLHLCPETPTTSYSTISTTGLKLELMHQMPHRWVTKNIRSFNRWRLRWMVVQRCPNTSQWTWIPSCLRLSLSTSGQLRRTHFLKLMPSLITIKQMRNLKKSRDVSARGKKQSSQENEGSKRFGQLWAWTLVITKIRIWRSCKNLTIWYKLSSQSQLLRSSCQSCSIPSGKPSTQLTRTRNLTCCGTQK